MSEIHGELGYYLLRSYLTCILHTARISNNNVSTTSCVVINKERLFFPSHWVLELQNCMQSSVA